MIKPTLKIFTIVLSLCVSFCTEARAQDGYCGLDVSRKVWQNLGVDQDLGDSVAEELRALAYENKGFNSLYELKVACEKAGFYALALRIKSVKNIEYLRQLLADGQLIANITGNRHFCLIQDVDSEKVSVYIPGLNFKEPSLSHAQFLEYWDRVVLLVAKDKPDIKEYKKYFSTVNDKKLKEILGAAYCGNACGSIKSASGIGGTVKGTVGNGSGRNQPGSSGAQRPDASTTEPVVIRNGNLYLEADDIYVPTLGLPLNLKRYYNSEIVSEVQGWLPEPGAGSWVIENGEYSGQGDRSVSDLKFKDFTMELDTKTIQPGSSSAWETAWVNIRYTESPSDPRKAQDCYYFIIHTSGKIELAKWQAGKQYFLTSKSSSYRPTNKNHIKIVAQAANIKIYINGTLSINYTDPSPLLAEGRVALESYYCHAHFDNVVITSGAKSYSYNFNSDDNEFIFGYGWTHSYSLMIKENSNHLTLYRENNSKELYAPQGGGIYKSLYASNNPSPVKDSSGYSLKTKHGIHYRFNLQGRLIYVEDRNLNRTNLSYSAIGGKNLLSSITEPSGRVVGLEYGVNNMVSRAYDPMGNSIRYVYNTKGQLVEVVDRNGNSTKYEYDAITGNLKKITDPENNTYTYNYIYNDRINDQTDPLGNKTTFDYLWSTVHVVNKRGEIYKYNFDGLGYLQSVTNPQGAMERSVNDSAGNVVEHYNKNGKQTYYTYDSKGNVSGVRDALNNWARFYYDTVYNQPTTLVDKRGNVVTLNYDTKGNLVQRIDQLGAVTSYAYNSAGRVISTANSKGKITTFAYDSYGNMVKKTDALGNITTYVYDILGRVVKVVDALGNSREIIYDNNGNAISVKDAKGNVYSYSYGANGHLASITDPVGSMSFYTYDCFGNLLSAIDAIGNSTSYAYDTANQMHLNRANRLALVDSAGNTTGYYYDSLDRLVKLTNQANISYQFTYDKEGNILSRKDGLNNITNFQYDVLNRLVRKSYPDGTYVSHTFDVAGNVTKMQDSTGITSYTYDKLNRMNTLFYPDATALTYAYDLNGNRLSLELSGLGKTLYDYDSLDRPVKITSPDAKTTQYCYDKLSRRTQALNSNGTSSSYVYDNLNRLTQLINKDKNLKEISRFTYAYDNLSRRISMNLINGSVSYSYDKSGRLIKESGALDSAPFSTTYAYDKAGNRLTSLEDGNPANNAYNDLNQLNQSYGADEKLIQAKGTVQDSSPVTVKVNDVSASVSGNQFVANNIRLVSGQNTIKAVATDSSGNVGVSQIPVTYSTSNALTNYGYDANGNLISKSTGSNSAVYYYDYENRLKQYSYPGQSASYVYNGRGERVSKTVNGVTTKYYYDGSELALEKVNGGSILYVHGPMIDEIVSDSRGYRYHYDGLGSVVNLTDSTGLSVASYAYKAFGQIRSQSGSVVNSWGFTGRQYDSESGLHFYRNRYYDSMIGRFITRDPIGTDGGINLYAYVDSVGKPISLGTNLYTYVDNNPVNFVDPWGLCKDKPWSEKIQLYLTLVGAQMEKGKMTNMQGLIGVIGVGAGAYSNIGFIPRAIGYSNKDFLQGGRMAYNWANQYGSGVKFYSWAQAGAVGSGLAIISAGMTGWTIGETINAYYWGYQDYKNQYDK